MKNEIQEAPNLIHLIYQQHLDKAWGFFLHKWENLIFSLIIACFISLLFFVGTRKKSLLPSGLQNILELVVELLQRLLREMLGTNGDKYLPFLGTLFLYILTMNLWGLIPLMKTPSTNLSITAAFAICVFFYVQFLNMKNMGFFGLLYYFAGSPKTFVGWLIVPLILPLELITQISRPISLALRLCGNMLGEHILVSVFALLGMTSFFFFAIPVAIPAQIPIVFLALLAGFMQALVFTVLSAVYILLTIPTEHH